MIIQPKRESCSDGIISRRITEFSQCQYFIESAAGSSVESGNKKAFTSHFVFETEMMRYRTKVVRFKTEMMRFRT